MMPCLFCGMDLDDAAHTNEACRARTSTAAPYSNPGKGTVLTNSSITSRLAELFNERAEWTSAELNARLGWQFSQAVYALRRRGWRITTLRIGPKAYAYRREAA